MSHNNLTNTNTKPLLELLDSKFPLPDQPGILSKNTVITSNGHTGEVARTVQKDDWDRRTLGDFTYGIDMGLGNPQSFVVDSRGEVTPAGYTLAIKKNGEAEIYVGRRGHLGQIALHQVYNELVAATPVDPQR